MHAGLQRDDGQFRSETWKHSSGRMGSHGHSSMGNLDSTFQPLPLVGMPVAIGHDPMPDSNHGGNQIIIESGGGSSSSSNVDNNSNKDNVGILHLH